MKTYMKISVLRKAIQLILKLSYLKNVKCSKTNKKLLNLKALVSIRLEVAIYENLQRLSLASLIKLCVGKYKDINFCCFMQNFF